MAAVTGTLCLFAKPPAPGRVKTRLAAAVGEARAAALAEAFLIDTVTALRDLDGTRLVLATTEVDGGFPAACDGLPRWDQGEGDLGARLERVLRRALSDAPWAVALGADSPGLPLALYRRLCDAVAGGAEAAIAPALDGGFWGLALRRCPPGLLASIPWSVPTTFEATLARLEARGWSPVVVAPWVDVDEAEDVARLADWIRDGRVHAPMAAAALADEVATPPPGPRISVVMPVYREAARVRATLDALCADAGVDEIVVVDGQSDDGSLAVARAHPDPRVFAVTGPRGRAAQLHAGARLARGEIVWFMHADVRPPPGATGRIHAALAPPDVVAGAFRTWTVPDDDASGAPPPRGAWLWHLADVRSRVRKRPYGDQAMFVRRSAYDAVGGFPDIPLMEDLALSDLLSRRGRIVTVPASVRVSGRRLADALIKWTVVWNTFPALYRLGVPPRVLARLYAHVR